MSYLEIILDSIRFEKISDEEYFSDKYKDYISSSQLKLLDPSNGGSLEKFHLGLQPLSSDYIELGNAIHCMLLQPDFYEISNITKPAGKLGKFADRMIEINGVTVDDYIRVAKEIDYYSGKLTKKRIENIENEYFFYWQQRRNEQKSEKCKIYLSNSNLNKYNNCINNIDKEILNLLNSEENYNEFAIFADVKIVIDDKEVILKLKGKIDNLSIDEKNGIAILNDIKTTSNSIEYFMESSFNKYKYYRQLSFYLWLLSSYFKKIGKSYIFNINIIAIETVPNFSSKIIKVNKHQIDRGIDEIKTLLLTLGNEYISKQTN